MTVTSTGADLRPPQSLAVTSTRRGGPGARGAWGGGGAQAWPRNLTDQEREDPLVVHCQGQGGVPHTVAAHLDTPGQVGGLESPGQRWGSSPGPRR